MRYEDESKQADYREDDRFSRLMFGERKFRKTDLKDENHERESPEEIEQSSFPRRKDDWFWGTRRNESAARHHFKKQKKESLLENIDFELLMETVDMFITTSKQYKPLIKEISPFFKGLTKKFKSSK